ncbi:hypothetical protein Tco_0956036 [Tanacetum coccineum]|uniref:FBD domain-containing protein n=1 Tax=Tanacetum coccineum TaxID=301880 RepID=A0ABQ5E8Z1_9ASTR
MPSEHFILVFLHQRMRNQRIAKVDWKLIGCGVRLGKRAFSSLFGEDVEYFAPRLFFNMDKLEKQLNAEEFNEEIAMVVFKLLADAEKNVLTTIPCLKSLNLHGIDFSSDIMAKYVYEFPQSALCSSDVYFSKMVQLQLQSVTLVRISGLKNEECLIKSLLSGSPLLRKMEIHTDLFQHVGVDNGKLIFATKLLELHRASPVAEIKLKFW